MSKRHLKEAEVLLTQITPLDKEERKKYLQEQIEQLKKVAYRYEVEIRVGQAYLKLYEKNKEEMYLTNGENKIQEAVQNLRGISIQVRECEKLLEEL